ncbi:MAG: hypothetical protein H6729_09415 [Deltaproteobacteria bacterium]|nr:hypothetical protein [Deltaproteobacteria bacterium]
MSGTTATTSSQTAPSTVIESCFANGDHEGYRSIFRTEGLLSDDYRRSVRYMQEHDARIANLQHKSRAMKLDSWKSHDLDQVKLKNAGLDESSQRRTVTAGQTPTNQLNFRILGARLS